MADLIERRMAYIFLTEYYNHRTENQHRNLREALRRVPDGVVRCKDCKYYGASHIKDGCVCFLDAGMCDAEPDDFCSRGVRKDDGRPD